jgi:L-ascorbate metabolism protein UlaG (beta-lactamase superfamily)
MNCTFYGHACFSIEYNGKTLLFDPFISGNEEAKNVNIDDIKADYILITHGHQDHILDCERIAKNNNSIIISTYEIVSYFEGLGIKGHPMNTGGQWSFDFGNVKLTNAVHTSSYPDGTYAGCAVGFVISGGDKTLYYAGDTALTMDMKLIPLTSPKLDYAFLPVGDNFTMGWKDAIIASEFIECNNIIAMHFDTFGYIKVDKGSITDYFKESGKQIQFLDINGSIQL